jgi:hypothetical protein
VTFGVERVNPEVSIKEVLWLACEAIRAYGQPKRRGWIHARVMAGGVGGGCDQRRQTQMVSLRTQWLGSYMVYRSCCKYKQYRKERWEALDPYLALLYRKVDDITKCQASQPLRHLVTSTHIQSTRLLRPWRQVRRLNTFRTASLQVH